MKVIVTGGAGFIGSALVRHLVGETDAVVVTVDKLTYAGNLGSLAAVAKSPRHHFEQIDICDREAVRAVLDRHRPDAIVHLAAESHVDRSIDASAAFIQTNVVGTHALLEESRAYLDGLDKGRREAFRFLHVSTDEVFGSLGREGRFDEGTPYSPRSPYAASKASSDHLVRAWHETYRLPVLLTNCSNNYGPYQFPEKLIPLMTLNALAGRPLPVYGRGENVRDWLYVGDHVTALLAVLERGRIGETYTIGGDSERSNLAVVEEICDAVERLNPGTDARRLISFVEDRPGHDFRYAIDASRIKRDLGWRPTQSFHEGLARTVAWYAGDGRDWCRRILDGTYNLGRLGLSR